MNYKKFSGAASAALMIAIAVTLVLVPGSWAASKYKILHKFSGKDGANPRADLIVDTAGNLYGTTEFGGNFKGPFCSSGCGVIFQLTPNADGSWTESVLYRFCSLPKCSDGALPSSALIFDQAGNLYGTTLSGGSKTCNFFCGTVYKLTPSGGGWKETVLYTLKL